MTAESVRARIRCPNWTPQLAPTEKCIHENPQLFSQKNGAETKRAIAAIASADLLPARIIDVRRVADPPAA